MQYFLMGRLQDALGLSENMTKWGQAMRNKRAASWGVLNQMRVLLAMGDRDGALALEEPVRAMWAHYTAMGMAHVSLSLQGLLVWCHIVKVRLGHLLSRGTSLNSAVGCGGRRVNFFSIFPVAALASDP